MGNGDGVCPLYSLLQLYDLLSVLVSAEEADLAGYFREYNFLTFAPYIFYIFPYFIILHVLVDVFIEEGGSSENGCITAFC